MKRLVRKNKEKNPARSMVSTIMIMLIATTAITWIGIMDINKD